MSHLIGRIKEAQELLALADLKNFLPLLLCGIDPCGIVGACVQQHNRAFLCLAQILQHALKVQALREHFTLTQALVLLLT